MHIGINRGLTIGGGFSPQAPNLLSASNTFSPGSSLTVTAAATTGPFGATDGVSLARTTTSATEAMFRRSAVGMANATAYAFAVFAKANSGGSLYLRNLAVDSTTSAGVVQFNLSTGAAVLTYGGTYTGRAGAIDFGGGWWRCWIAGTTLNPIVNNLLDIGVTDGTSAVGGASGNSIFVFGAQLNVGLYPSTYRAT